MTDSDDGLPALPSVRSVACNSRFLPLSKLKPPADSAAPGSAHAPLRPRSLIAASQSFSADGADLAEADAGRFQNAVEDRESDKWKACSTSANSQLQAQIRSSPVSSEAEEEVPLTQISFEASIDAEFSAAIVEDDSLLDPLGSSPFEENASQGLPALELPIPQAPRDEEPICRNRSLSPSPPQSQQLTLAELDCNMLQTPAKRKKSRKTSSEQSFTEILCSVPQAGARSSGRPSAKKRLRVAVVENTCRNSRLHHRASSEPAHGYTVPRLSPPRFSAMLVKPATTPARACHPGFTAGTERDAAEANNARALVPYPACILPPGSSVLLQSGKALGPSNAASGSSSSNVATAPTSQESCPSSNAAADNRLSERGLRARLTGPSFLLSACSLKRR